MWIGGVRVVILDEERNVLMVEQKHEGRDIWMLPGGAIEEGENSLEAGIREVMEETGLEIEMGPLLWHVEEVAEGRGQRFVDFFIAELKGGKLGLGYDPELGEAQVLEEVKFLSKEEIISAEHVYPEYLKTELWDVLEGRVAIHNAYKVRTKMQTD